MAQYLDSDKSPHTFGQFLKPLDAFREFPENIVRTGRELAPSCEAEHILLESV